MSSSKYEIKLTWNNPDIINKTITKDAIENILMVSSKSALNTTENRFQIVWYDDYAEILFQNEQDLNFLTQYKHKLEKIGYNIVMYADNEQKECNNQDNQDNEHDSDDDLNLDDIHITPQGPPLVQQPQQQPQQPPPASISNNLIIYNINDLVEINSEPEDNNNSHLHKGQVVKKTKDQITIKENTETNNYFIDEVSIKLIQKHDNNTTENDAIIKIENKININSNINNNTTEQTLTLNEQPLALNQIDLPTNSRNDSFFGNFNKNNDNNELEKENVAVSNLFSVNKALQSKSHAKLFPNITAPLQGNDDNNNNNNNNSKLMKPLPPPDIIQQSFSHGILANNNPIHSKKNTNIDRSSPFKCNLCNKSIRATDWTNNNVQQILVGTKWKHKKCNEYNNKLYINSIVSLNSQYTAAVTHSYVINALEAVLQLQMGADVSSKLIDKILQLSSVNKQNKYTQIDDIFTKVKRYNNNLCKVDEIQINIKKLNETIQNKLTKNMSAVITKSSDTIFVHNKSNKRFIIYDSQPRANPLNGSHFLIFDNMFNALKYLNNLWPKQITLCDIMLFKLKENVNPSLIPNIKQISIELKQIGSVAEEKQHDEKCVQQNDSVSIDLNNIDENIKNYIHKLSNEIVQLKQENKRLQLLYEEEKNKNKSRNSSVKQKKEEFKED